MNNALLSNLCGDRRAVGDQSDEYSPTFLNLEYGQLLVPRYADSNSSRWKKRWHGCEMAIEMSGSMFL